MEIQINVYFNDIEGSKKEKGNFKTTITCLENLYNNGIKLSKGDETFINSDDLEIMDEDFINENNLEDMFILTNTCYSPTNNSFLLQFKSA
jgi:hypothetical protein